MECRSCGDFLVLDKPCAVYSEVPTFWHICCDVQRYYEDILSVLPRLRSFHRSLCSCILYSAKEPGEFTRNIVLDKARFSSNKYCYFSHFFMKTYVVGAH